MMINRSFELTEFWIRRAITYAVLLAEWYWKIRWKANQSHFQSIDIWTYKNCNNTIVFSLLPVTMIHTRATYSIVLPHNKAQRTW